MPQSTTTVARPLPFPKCVESVEMPVVGDSADTRWGRPAAHNRAMVADRVAMIKLAMLLSASLVMSGCGRPSENVVNELTADEIAEYEAGLEATGGEGGDVIRE